MGHVSALGFGDDCFSKWVFGVGFDGGGIRGIVPTIVIAEIELKSEAERFEKPAWLGREVTGQRRYDNSALAS